MDAADAKAFADFLLPMLKIVPKERATASAMLAHPWLAVEADELEPIRQRVVRGGKKTRALQDFVGARDEGDTAEDSAGSGGE